jgi:hypothetical protein
MKSKKGAKGKDIKEAIFSNITKDGFSMTHN